MDVEGQERHWIFEIHIVNRGRQLAASTKNCLRSAELRQRWGPLKSQFDHLNLHSSGALLGIH